jgi:NADH-quinone oxidoreductase subunit C
MPKMRKHLHAQSLPRGKHVAEKRHKAAQTRTNEWIKQQYGSDRVFQLDKLDEPVITARDGADYISLVEKLGRDEAVKAQYLSDLTAYDNVDHIDGAKRFIVVAQLYSMTHHTRVRVKLNVDEDEEAPTLCKHWSAANWLEREVFDMYGIRFRGHPDMRRILMDERFVGYPLRKEYDIHDRQPFPDSLPVRIAHGEENT